MVPKRSKRLCDGRGVAPVNRQEGGLPTENPPKWQKPTLCRRGSSAEIIKVGGTYGSKRNTLAASFKNSIFAHKSRFYINESEKMSINVDKSREKFDIKFDAIGNARNITAKGVYKESTNWASVQLTKITYSPSMYESERVIKCDIMAILQQNDTLPTFSASYSKFSSITEDEVDAWHEKIGS